MEKSIINFLPILSLLASLQGQGGYLALLINVAEPDLYVLALPDPDPLVRGTEK
jgi:hypothetical protein